MNRVTFLGLVEMDVQSSLEKTQTALTSSLARKLYGSGAQFFLRLRLLR